MTFDLQGTHTRNTPISGLVAQAHPVPDQGGSMDLLPASRLIFRAASTPKKLDRHRFSANNMSTSKA